MKHTRKKHGTAFKAKVAQRSKAIGPWPSWRARMGFIRTRFYAWKNQLLDGAAGFSKAAQHRRMRPARRGLIFCTGRLAS
jgi:hypothetical protein